MNNPDKIDKNNVEDIIALSAMQEGLLFHYLKNSGGLHYFEQLSITISGYINIEYLKRAWDYVITCNKALRTIFRWEKIENPVQIVLKKYDLPFKIFDFSHCGENEKSLEIEKVKKDDTGEKIDIRTAPFRITVCKCKEDECELIITNHHILYDGWSTGIIIKEFFEVYNSISNNEELPYFPRTDYKQYIKFCQNQDRSRYDKFWKEYLRGIETPTIITQSVGLTKCRLKNSKASYSKCKFVLDTILNEKIVNFVKEYGLTPAALFYSAWGLLLHVYTNSRDVLFGTTFSGRPHEIKDIDKMVGLFINTLPLRMTADSRETALDFIKKVSGMISEVSLYQYISLTDIKKCSEMNGSGEMFDSLVAIENYPVDKLFKNFDNNPGIKSYSMSEVTHYPLTLEIINSDFIKLELIYDENAFDGYDIERIFSYYSSILENIVLHPHYEIPGIIMIPEDDRLFIGNFNNTLHGYPENKVLHELFEDQVSRTPDAIALMSDTMTVTYSELNKKSNQLANSLRARGVRRDTVVPIIAHRSIEMIVGIFGILKAGGAYLPIDPTLPSERIGMIINESNSAIVLTQSGVAENIEFQGEVIDLNNQSSYSVDFSNPRITNNPLNLAYVIFTSGSTGNPKGVMIEHKSAVNILAALQDRYPLMDNDVYLFKTTYTFDVSVAEIFGWFFSGGRLAILEKDGEKDPSSILDAIKKYKVTHINFVPSMFNVFLDCLDCEDAKELKSLKYVFVAGEAMQAHMVKKFHSLIKGVRLENIYGPTESTIYATAYPLELLKNDAACVPIGKPLNNIKAYITGPYNNLQPIGVPGELCLAGLGLARGYINNGELTEEKFITNSQVNGERLYKTGDLAVLTKDAYVLYSGRMDNQVKIRGFRVEPGEIESRLLDCTMVKEAICIAHTGTDGSNYLCAYVIAEKGTYADDIKNHLEKSLPAYMIPAFILFLESMPLTRSGKIDRKSLPEPGDMESSRPHRIPPSNVIENRIFEIWREVLGNEKFGTDDNFFDIGGNSLHLIRVHNKLLKKLNRDISIVKLFEYPSIKKLADFINRIDEKKTSYCVTKSDKTNENKGTGIAVIGMSGRFPGANTIEQFWNNLLNGKESITFFDEMELLKAGVKKELLLMPNYVRAKGILENIDMFDAGFFGFSPKEAEITDPQQRLFLECAWESLEDAGYDPYRYDGRIGIYAGVSMNTYFLNLYADKETMNSIDELQAFIANDKDFMPSRVSYKLNLRGPSVNVQTACSTSLVAIHLACTSLINKECDMALAGGSSVRIPNKSGYIYQPNGINSPDGHCRAFDKEANGTVGGNGVGIVVLKNLSDAIKDNDHIYAVIKGSAINNDGSEKIGYTAPGVEGQSRVISEAFKSAGADPGTVTYIETHGTGTELGDPIEVAALKRAFGGAAGNNYCAIGSLKTNIGHLDVAAGVAGFIKTVLSLKNKVLLPSLHFKEPNARIDFHDSPFYVITSAKEWETAGNLRRAGVSSFGIGGTNAHVVLEEAPVVESDNRKRDWNLFTLSAKTKSALEKITSNLEVFLTYRKDISLSDVAYTLNTGRAEFKHRKAFVCRNIEEAIELLKYPSPGRIIDNSKGNGDPFPVFIFPCQGSHYINMGKELYDKEIVFKQNIDKCARILQKYIQCDIREVIYPEKINSEAEKRLNMTMFAQPALFIVEYSLAMLWISWGIKPNALIGQGIGEYVAACLSGVFTLEHALMLAAKRPHLVSHAVHSQVMKPLLDDFRKLIKNTRFKKPEIPFISSITGNRITDEDAVDTEYWMKQITHEEHFEDGIKRLMQTPGLILLEVGPGNALSGIVEHYVKGKNDVMLVSSLCRPDDKHTGMEYLFTTLGKLWTKGINVQWNNFYAHERRGRISLPTYPFERKRYWMKANDHGEKTEHPISSITKNPDLNKWFYAPVWKQCIPLPVDMECPDTGCWMIFNDQCGLGDALRNYLVDRGQSVIIVNKGERFGRLDEYNFQVNPLDRTNYRNLIHEIEKTLIFPRVIIHLWGVTEQEDEIADSDETYEAFYKNYSNFSFYSIVYLLQAMDTKGFKDNLSIKIVTSNMYSLNAEPKQYPEKAIATGLSKVIPQEYENVKCQCIDIDIKDLFDEKQSKSELIKNILLESSGDGIAFRNGNKWIQVYENFDLPKGHNSQILLKNKGTYIITGGLGGIGLTIAEFIAKKAGAKIALTGLSKFPERDQWESILTDDTGQTRVVKDKIKILLEIEKYSSGLMILNADVSNFSQMSRAIEKIKKEFGRINGAIHAAGKSSGAAIQNIVLENIEEIIKPKVIGTRIIARLLESDKPDFIILFSSLNSLTGGFGQAAYCAANSFMDVFAGWHTRISKNTTMSINWDTWNEVGMASRIEFKGAMNEIWQLNRARAINPDEGKEIFGKLLFISHIPQIAVCTCKLNEWISHNREFYKGLRDVGQKNQNKESTKTILHPRPELAIQYVPPRNAVEIKLEGIWKMVLGIDRVGIHDNFFELGGNSLIGVQLISEIKRQFDIDIPLVSIYEGPNICSIGEIIENKSNRIDDATDSRLKRAKFRKERMTSRGV